MILEKEMDNRGSKSVIGFNTHTSQKPITLKEQRVDGSWYFCKPLASNWSNQDKRGIFKKYLRCTLKSFERNHQIKILSTQIIQYSTQTPEIVSSVVPKYNPWFITGFTDAEGSFIVSISKYPGARSGWNVQVKFKISLHTKDLHILEEIQRYFGGVGKIDKAGKDRESVSYAINSRKLIIAVILPHFDLYPLITQNKADYELFKRIILMMNDQEHLTDLGFQEIINIRASLNLGLSEGLKEAFPSTKPVSRPLVLTPRILSPQWVAGFVSGEGTFYVATSESTTEGLNVRLRFIVSQDSRDEDLMKSLITYFDCGACEKAKDGMVYYRVTKFADNHGKILAFFSKHQLAGVKAKDFDDWCFIADLIQTKAHLTKEGSNQIINLKARMNKGRVNGL